MPSVRHSIRPADVSDLASLARLEKECFGATGVAIAQLRWLLEGQGDSPAFFVSVAHEASDPRALLGFVCWKMKLDQDKPYFDILDLSVGKNFREERVEHDLLEAVFASAGPVGAIGVSVNVPQTNMAAAAFYLSLGFQVLHTVPKYYADGGTMEVFAKRLK